MRALKMRLLHTKINKIIIFLVIAILVTWNISYIFESCTCTSNLNIIKQIKDDNCDRDAIESGWVFNAFRNLILDPDDTRIFFHATSCKRGLTSRQACSVESTARANPERRIYVIFIGQIDKAFKKGYMFEALRTLENVEFVAIDLMKYIQGTPFEIMDLEDIILMTKKHNLADLLKYLTLYKFGGVYMDMDFIVGRSFDDLCNNWAGKPHANVLGTDVLSFSNDDIGRMIANATVQEIAAQSHPLSGDRGLKALTRALEKICSTKSIAKMSAATCKGFKFYGKADFYPVGFQDVANFYIPDSNYNLLESYNAYAHKMWSEITGISKYPNHSLVIDLARQFCPSVFQLYGDDFGV